jgi:hypothetical protein
MSLLNYFIAMAISLASYVQNGEPSNLSASLTSIDLDATAQSIQRKQTTFRLVNVCKVKKGKSFFQQTMYRGMQYRIIAFCENGDLKDSIGLSDSNGETIENSFAKDYM